MKKSNIILISAALLAISCLLLSGWLQANAYKIILSGKTCSYAVFNDQENSILLLPFKNIKVEIDKNSVSPTLSIQHWEKHELVYGNGYNNTVFSRVSGDTLFVKIKNLTHQELSEIVIRVPLLNTINITSGPDESRNGGTLTYISGFIGKKLSINNNGPNVYSILNNKLNKFELKGDFYKLGTIRFSYYSDYDSLDIDIKGQEGTLKMGIQDPQFKVNPKQWINIKVPKAYHIEASALLTSKITIKK
jgi:hypothetical protein